MRKENTNEIFLCWTNGVNKKLRKENINEIYLCAKKGTNKNAVDFINMFKSYNSKTCISLYIALFCNSRYSVILISLFIVLVRISHYSATRIKNNKKDRLKFQWIHWIESKSLILLFKKFPSEKVEQKRTITLYSLL